MAEPVIQTSDLARTFQALRSRDPSKIGKQIIEEHPDYKRVPRNNYSPVAAVNTGSWGMGMSRFAASAGVVYGQPAFFSPVHTPINWQIPSKRLEQYQWARFFYENEPKVASAIDFYSDFPMGDWEHECRNRDVKLYFDRFKKRLKLPKWCRLISHEVHLLGDCFPFIEIDCPHCFPENTMVLTVNGHKPIQDLRVNDEVLTIDGTFRKIDAKMEFGYNGEMVTIKRQSLPDIKSTSDHKHFIVKPEYRPDNRVKDADWDNVIEVEAKDVKVGDYICAPFNSFLKEDITKILFDGPRYRVKNKHLAKKIEIDIDEDFARLIGWYVAEGSTDSNRSFQFSLNGEKEQEIAVTIKGWIEKYFLQDSDVKPFWARNVVQVIGYSRELSAWFDEQCGHGSINKRIPSFIMRSPKNIKKAFLEAYLQGDGHARKSRNENTLGTISRTLCFDCIALLSDLGYSCYVCEKEEGVDSLGIHRNHSYFINYRIDNKRENGQGTHKEKLRIFYKVKEVSIEKEETVVYNITVNTNHNYVANYCLTKNCYGSGKLGDEICDHEGGTVRRVVIMNPDYIEVYTSPINPDPIIAMRPDEELINMVQRKTPGYERLSPDVIKLISAGQPIRLDNRNVFHLKYGECGYQKYGVGMVRRLFPILSYKTKLMVAQWIVAERLIVPIKIVKVGSDERPAGPADIADVQAQLAMTAQDPNLTIITHHAFELDFVGAAGRVLTLSNEFEFINQEVLDGMMINNALLNGEGPNFSSAAVGIEAMIQRLETFRQEVSQWIEQSLYLPEAKRQGFIDKNPETGEDEYLIPKIKWGSMHLRDQQQYRTFMIQLYDKGVISAQTLLESFDLDPDQEIERKRYDALQMMALGQGFGQQQGMGGGFGGGGGGGGGGLPPLGGGGGAPPIGAPGGEMGGPGGAPGAGPSPVGGGVGGPPMAKASSMTAEVADPNQFGGRVLKKKTRERLAAEQKKIFHQQEVHGVGGKDAQGQMRDEKGRVVFTKCERALIPRLMKAQQEGLIESAIYPQYRVRTGTEEYSIDFGIPEIKLGIEADGEIFHSSGKQVTHDKERDMKLAQQGWTILRFTDVEIENKLEQVIRTVIQSIMRKKLSLQQEAGQAEGQKTFDTPVAPNVQPQ